MVFSDRGRITHHPEVDPASRIGLPRAAVFTNSSLLDKSGHLGEWAARREILPEPTPGPIAKSARCNPRGRTIRTGDLQ